MCHPEFKKKKNTSEFDPWLSQLQLQPIRFSMVTLRSLFKETDTVPKRELKLLLSFFRDNIYRDWCHMKQRWFLLYKLRIGFQLKIIKQQDKV
ncbi:hypothetical protein INR49_027344 [Caranx melampygus]|nr:hypothetical protein INR49_027344 [Caranx melampygus]